MIIEWYKAWTIVENNISLFIQHMIAKRKQKYLVPKQQVLFLKDLGSDNSDCISRIWLEKYKII